MKIRVLALFCTLLSLGSCQLLDFFSPAKLDDAPTLIPATSLSLTDDAEETPTDVFLTVGESKTFTASVSPVDSTDAVVWTSSSPESVSVTQDGVVKLVAAPSAPVTITATAGQKTSSFTVSLRIAATSLRFLVYMGSYVDHDLDPSYEVSAGALWQIGGQTLPLETTDKIVWTVSDPSQVSLSDTDPTAADSSQPNGNAARTLMTPSITVTATKFAYAAAALTSDVVITATAGSLVKTLTLKPTPTVTLTWSADNGATYTGTDLSSHLGGNGSNNVYLQAVVTPENASVIWSSDNLSNATIGTPTTTTVNGTQVSRVVVHCLANTGYITVTVGSQSATASVQPSGG